MTRIIPKLWNNISNAGTSPEQSRRERNSIILLNRSWLILILIQCFCLCLNISNGIFLLSVMTAAYIAGLSVIHLLIRRGHVNAGKIWAIIVINLNTALMAVFLGEHTHLIDFLMLTALLPLYLFEIRKSTLIFWGMAASIIPIALYHYFAPSLAPYALPPDVQMGIYHTTNWIILLCLATLLYLIYNKNAAYEKEVLEKEEELTGQKKLYESILEQIPIDIVTFDQDLNYTYINSAAIKDPAVRQWLIGKSNTDYFIHRNLDVKGAHERDSILKQALSKGQPAEFEEMFVNQQGVAKYTLKGACPIYSDIDKGLTGLVGYSFDITAIKEAEKKLKEYSAELERKNDDLHHFVNATSHDLKSPLRNIASHLQLLERKNGERLDEESHQLIAYTIKSVKHLNQLIGDIYQYSVADRNDKPMVMADLNSIIELSLKQLDEVITSKNAVITCGQLPALMVSPSHFQTLFSNLVGNALKYNTCKGPTVNISATATGTEHIISVTDNGIGIAPEYQHQIFEIFQRLHSPEEYEGTGVGLAICSKIVDNYGGRIWVESQPGKGSTFCFTLDKELVEPNINIQGEGHNIFPYNNLAIAG